MKRYLPIGTLLILLLACCPCGSLLSLMEEVTELPISVGTDQSAAPDFTLQSLDGSWVTLSDLQGQVVVIDFWATWCGPCIDSLPHLQDLHEQYADQDVVVLAINIEESPGEIESRIGDEYTFTILLDSEGKVSDDYSVWAIPHTIVIDQYGVSQEVPMGPTGVDPVIQELLP